MSVRALAAVGAAGAVVGVVLLVAATADVAGALAAVAVAALAVGAAAVVAAGLLALRTVHRQLRELRTTLRAERRAPAGEGRRSSTRGPVTPEADVTPQTTDAAPGPDAPSAPPPTVVQLDDPVAATLAGALPYHDAARELPDEQPLPALQVRHDPAAPGCRLELEQFAGDERLAVHTLDVQRVPLDRAACPPRRRVHPAERTVLELRTGDHLDVAERARHHRYVVVPQPAGDDPMRDPALGAALLLRLVAGGTPCRVDADVAARLELLSPALRESLVADAEVAADGHVGDPADDDLALAALAARQKRLAWRDHDLRLGWAPPERGRDDSEVADATADGRGGAARGWGPELRPMRRPTVSVALTSRRPELVPVALAMIAAQRDVELEVVVALHGCGDAEEAERQLAGAGLDGRAMVVDAAVPFGAVVDAAAGAGSGEYVLKWDDDDLYGPDHVLDLVLAQRQTGAGVVGKAPEFVHFEQDATTVWRTPGKAEATSLGLAGGTLLTPRAALDEVGGYPPVGRAVDHYLKVAMRDSGLGVFRTHGFGFVLRRHGLGHTWTDTEDRYRAQAVRTFAGIPPVVGLGDAARFAPLAAVTGEGG